MTVGPSYISQDELDTICLRTVDTDQVSVRKAIAEAAPTKHRGAFYFWLSKHATPEQVDQFGRIMRARADGYQDDCLEIADQVTETPPTLSDDQPGVFNSSLSERVALAKMRIETRLKVMAQNETKNTAPKSPTSTPARTAARSRRQPPQTFPPSVLNSSQLSPALPVALTRLLANPTAIEDELQRRSVSAFIQKAFRLVDPGAAYSHNWHVDLIGEYLEAVHRREITRLIINIPPEYLKSISVNVAWPAWELGQNPSERIVSASYADRLSVKHSVDCRLLIKSPWYRRLFPDVHLTGDQNEKTKFMTTARGQRLATSVGGMATGDGGNILIVDDPLNPKQAASEAERETANIWFDQTFTSRLRDKKRGAIVVIMQRLHERDLTGHLLEKGGWEHLNLPAVAETRTIIDFGRVHLVREIGDLLHAEREGLDEIERVKREFGSYAFSAQYQQSPAPAGGGVIQLGWFRRFRERAARPDLIVQSWDTASKQKEHNDPSVGQTWLVTNNGYQLADLVRVRQEYPDLKRTIINAAEKWNPTHILIEDKSSGQALLQDIRRETKLPVLGIIPTQDKATRARAESAAIERGLAWLPEQAPWLNDFEREVMLFPNAGHDDQVDAMVQFLAWIKTKQTQALPQIWAS